MPRRRNKIRSRLIPSIGERVPVPKTAEPPEELKYPAFSLKYTQKKYCISKCTEREKSDLTDSIHIYCQMTWTEIQQTGKHKRGSEKIKELESKIPRGIRIAKGATIISLRFSGMKAMYGFRKTNVFYALWFDPEFELIKH